MIEEAPAKAPQRKTKIGIVVSDKMQKTCVVAVDNFQRHPLYGRTMRRTRRFKVADYRLERISLDGAAANGAGSNGTAPAREAVAAAA